MTHNRLIDLGLNPVKGVQTMSASAWEDLKEEICTQLLIGRENGEAELETITHIVWELYT